MIKSLVIAATLLVYASTATAVPRNTVKAHIDKAMKAHKEGKFDVALDELKAAYALDPKPDLLFAIAQVYVKLDKCDDAVVYYEKFLATTKDPQAKQVVTQAIEACKANKPEPTPDPTPKIDTKPDPKPDPVVDPKPDPKPDPGPGPTVGTGGGDKKDDPFASGRSVKSTGSPWYKDPLGDALLIGGVLAGAGAFVMFSGASSASDKAEQAPDEDVYREQKDKAENKQTFGIVLGAASAALVTGAVVRYVTRGSKKEETRVSLTPTHDGGFVTVFGRF